MDPRGRALLALTAAALASGVAAVPAIGRTTAAAGDETPRPSGRLIAVLDRHGAPIGKVAARTGVEVADRVPELGLFSAAPRPGQSVAELRQELLADPAVQRVDTEYLRRLRGYVPSDPAYSAPDPNAPGGDRAQWNLRKEGFEEGWTISRGGGSKVAIVDTGVSNTHPDLQQVAAAVDNDPTAPTGAQSDENGHGTHVAGLACGDGDNGYGIVGAGFDCSLIVEKADVSGNNFTSDTPIINGIVDAANRGADAINLSLGGGGQDLALRDAINYAWARNTVVVAAAENSNTTNQGFPARYVQPTGTAPNLFTCPAGDAVSNGCARGLVVTMAEYDGTPSSINPGHGTGVSIAAYGDSAPALPGIFSSWPANQTFHDTGGLLGNPPPCGCRVSFGGDDRFAYLLGTSMATPQVAGLVALIRADQPGMPAPEVVRIIKQTASNGGAWGDPLGWGIINAGAALGRTVFESDDAAPTSATSSRRRSGSRRFTVEVSGGDSGPSGKPGSGLAKIDVFVAKNQKSFRLLRTVTGLDKDRFLFRGKRGKRYRFFSQATDRAGNREAAPANPDSSTLVRRRH